MTDPDHVWQQVCGLMEGATESATLIAPFIKKPVLEAVIEATPPSVRHIRCVTRWTPAEVAAGVSDPEIISLAAERLSIELCPSLHAKIYIADDRCVVGSANLTAKATGRAPAANIELLLDAPATHAEVQRVLQQIALAATPATPHLAALVRQQADLLQAGPQTPLGADRTPGQGWYPITRRPENVYAFYSQRAQFPPAVEAGILNDLALLDIPAGLQQQDFNATVQARLHDIPEVHKLELGDSLSSHELQQAITERTGATPEQARRTAENIAAWLKHFGHYYTEVGSWQLRRGREII